MKRWSLLAPLLLAIVLAACGNTQQTGATSTNVPTSNTEPLSSGLPSVAPAATAEQTEVANEEITVSPETITVEPDEIEPGATATTDAGNAAETATAGAGGATPGGTSTGEWDCGDKSQLTPELAIFSWADYWPEEDDNNLFADFEAACGVQVTLNTFASNEELAAKIRAGNSGYDIILPSDYMVDILAQEGRLAKLDKALLPNIANLDPNQLGLYYDPNNDYSIPFQYGVTGIAYNKAEVNPAPDSWAALFEPAQLEPYRGRISMFDDEREGVGAALKYKGFSYNSTDAAQLEQAKQLLLAQKPFLARYDSEAYTQGLSSGELVLAQAWNGNTSLAKAENADIEFVIPKEGAVIWQDNLAIPADAPNIYTAHVFMNNVLDGMFGARITNFTYYLTPNLAAEPLLDADVKALQYYPTAQERQRLEYIERKGDPALYSDIWTAVKGE